MRKKRNVAKGIAAGLAAGIAGAWAMEQFQRAWLELIPHGEGESTDSGDPSTIQAAQTFSRLVLRRPIQNQRRAGEIAHYAVGAVSGAMYGGLAEVNRTVRAGAGSLYGVGLFVMNDEIVIPAAGWSKPRGAYPVSSHLYGLVSHVVFGLATEGARRLLRAAI